MLIEFNSVRQEKDSYRRLFTDEDIDLYVWYDNSRTNILGFQLVYGKKNITMRAFSWETENGYSHAMVDDSGWYNPTPILAGNSISGNAKITKQFKEKSKELDKEISSLVLDKIFEYNTRK